MSGSRGRALACGKLRGRGVGNGELVFGHEFPDEGAEFTSNRNDDFLFTFASSFEPDIAFVKSVLHAPGERFDRFRLAFLAFAKRSTHLGSLTIVLSAFDKHPSSVTIAAFGDGALLSFRATAFFAGNKPKESHELARVIKASKVSEFPNNGHRGDLLKAFAGHESFDDGFPLPGF